jgi:hypothetical protein
MSKTEVFVGEPIIPVPGTFDTAAMARGEPGLPQRFLWDDKEYVVKRVLEKWKETSPCRSGAGEQYARKHWYRIRTADNTTMKIYFERSPRSRRRVRAGWWLFSAVRRGKEVGS